MKFRILNILIFLLMPGFVTYSNGNTGDLNFEAVKITPYTGNELRAVASVTLTDTANVFFRYKTAREDSTQYLYTTISENAKNHTLTLTALKQLTNYQIEAIAFNKNNYISIDTFAFSTNAINERLDNFNNNLNTGFYSTPQYTITNIPTGLDSYFIVTDLFGNIVWYHKYKVDFNSCNAWRLTNHNTILYADCKQIFEIDLLGNVLRNIEVEEPGWNFHHDLQYFSNGDIAAIYAQPENVIVESGEETTVIVDGYVVFNKSDNIVYNWKASDFFDATEARRMGGYWFQVYGSDAFDWCHFNSIAEDFDNNILISVSHWSKVLKINRFSGEVIWELGEDGTLAKDSTFRIHRQHSVESIAPHKYLLFDNLGADGASRALGFAVDPDTNSAFPFWEYKPAERITSPTRGNIQQLPNGNTLVFFPTQLGHIHEVNSNGELTWKIDVKRAGYRAYRLQHLVEPHPEVSIEISDTLCNNDAIIDIITKPTSAYLSGDAIVDNKLHTEGLAGTIQTIKAVYGNNSVERNVFIAPKENAHITVNESTLQISEEYENYQWFFENDSIDNGTNAILIPSEDGQYFASFQNQYGCTNYSDTINYVKTNILNYPEAIDYKIITNKKIIEIYVTSNALKTIELFTLEGKLLLTQQIANETYKIPMHNFTGLCILKIESENNIFTKKIIL